MDIELSNPPWTVFVLRCILLTTSDDKGRWQVIELWHRESIF